ELSHDEYVFLDSLSADLVVIEDDVFAAEDVIEETVVLDVAEEIESAEEEIILFEEADITLEKEQQLSNEESPAKEENTVEEIIEKSDAVEITQTATNDDSYTGDFEIIIDEAVVDEVAVDEDVVDVTATTLDIDPVLLKIYHDESQGYVEVIRGLISECESNGSLLKADKSLIRAFHTLYGSARTAQVEPIAELSGSAEKYVKIRQESGNHDIPDKVTVVFKEIEQSISNMLSSVADGNLPAENTSLSEKINKIVQQEIQAQLQQSWQDTTPSEDDEIVERIIIDEDDNVAGDEDDFSVDIMDLSPDNNVIEFDVNKTVNDDVVIESESDSAIQIIEQPVTLAYGDIDEELIDIFLEEAEELLESCEVTLNEIKKTPNSVEHVQLLQRNMHTLKGGARMADLGPIGDLTHTLESLVVMVSENNVKTDKALFDILHESMDALTTMLADVKERQPLTSVVGLNDRLEMLMRGELIEKRAIERFDIELSELEAVDDEELEDINVSDFLPAMDVVATKVIEDPKKAGNDMPHWGERATDVNFKDTQEQVRVRADLLNNLVNYAGEVNIYHARMGKQITDFGFNLSELTQTVVRLKEQLRNLEIETEIQIRSGYETESDNYDVGFDPLEMDQYSTLQQLTRSLSETAADVDNINESLIDITRDSETLLVQESRVSTDLQEGLMRTRMVRFGGLSSRLRRIVRQIGRELGKDVELEIAGENSEVDRTVLDRIIAPLEHMLRNAVAHGIEKPEQRKISGKDEVGKIKITVAREGTDVVIDIQDDGAGIDADKVKDKAVKMGLITHDTVLSDHDALQFILQSGFSTADHVTQVAGRGVGMDVVDSEIKQLGGILDIDTVKGQGTKFNIRLPLTLAINQALLVTVGDDLFAVPLASIEGVVRMTGYELQRFYDSENSHYEFNNIEFELKHLGGLLTGNQPDYAKQLQLFPVLLVRVGEKHFALHVDNMMGRREIVVKPVGMQIGSVRGIAGATILADGRVVLILEMSALVTAESLFTPQDPVETVDEVVNNEIKTIMVVDDSITIRKITERMLKRYGIEVMLAKDGIDATSQLQDNMPDLMLLDIEMPRMDGFEVASFVRNDDRLKDLPIIMITSRTGVKHKEKALEIGVNQYLGKPFQEEDLLHNINQILHTDF
ncbi:MAG: response regulator, partial [Gammaproteobacteria bacterium]|nr:response regulator [Gammaproteobacteria bacterium]